MVGPLPPPGYAPFPFPSSSDRTRQLLLVMAAVLGAVFILVIVFTLVIAGVLFVLITGPLPATDPAPAFELDGGPWESGSLNASVTEVREDGIAWRGLTPAVVTQEGEAYFRGESGVRQQWEGVRTRVTYHDQDMDGFVSAGDWIQVRVEPEDAVARFDGGELSATLGGRRMASLGL